LPAGGSINFTDQNADGWARRGRQESYGYHSLSKMKQMPVWLFGALKYLLPMLRQNTMEQPMTTASKLFHIASLLFCMAINFGQTGTQLVA